MADVCNTVDENIACVCCEFPTEGSSLAVGYSQWIIPENDVTVSADYLQQKIGQRVKIRWPSDLDVQPPRQMQKTLAKQKPKWDTVVAIIKAYGSKIQV